MENPMDFIKRRNRQQWKELARERWINVRIWAQEHGEKAFAAGLIFGIFLILFPWLVYTLLVTGILAAAVVYFLADPPSLTSTTQPEKTTMSGDSDEPED